MSTRTETSRPAYEGTGTVAPPARWPAAGLIVGALLVAASMTLPEVVGWDVDEAGVHPLSAVWNPRFGPGTVPAFAIGLAAIAWGPGLAHRLPWRVLVPVTWVASAAWLVSLATVDGRVGIAGVLGKSSEFLPTARGVGDITDLLHGFVARIPFSASPHNWPIAVAGHPPGALLFFVALVRLGLGGDLAAGLVVIALAATTPAAVVLTVRRLGSPGAARTVAPFLVFGPAAIWTAVSADAVFTAWAAWGLCLLAYAATATSARARAAQGLGAGLLLGYLPYLSYGMVLIGPLALAIALMTRGTRAVGWALLAAGGVVATFTIAGFSWWQAYPVLSDRYWDGAAHNRPGAYWTWADLALLVISAGPALAAGAATGAYRVRQAVRARGFGADADARRVLCLAGAAALAVTAADVSQMSRAEVERIWLPFEPWLLLTLVLLPASWRRWLLPLQVGTALVVQTLLFTRW